MSGNAQANAGMQFRTTVGGVDFFPTEPRFVDALLAHEPFEGEIWEPACGEGDMSDRLKLRGHDVFSSDIIDYGYAGCVEFDFLKADDSAENIVTNPPFKLFDQFVNHGLSLARKKLALICGVPTITRPSKARTELLRVAPPKKIISVTNPMCIRTTGKKSMFPHCWVVWEHGYEGPTQFVWHTFEKGQK